MKVTEGKNKHKSLWRESCEQLREDDDLMAKKEAEIEALKKRLAELGLRRSGSDDPDSVSGSSLTVVGRTDRMESPSLSVPATVHRGKAPPIDAFDGESADVRFDDWYPMLQRATAWNGWGERETLLQLAGHLRKRALLEWNLLDEKERSSLNFTVTALRERLDPGSQSTESVGIITYHPDVLTPAEQSAVPVMPSLGGKDPGVENQNQHDGAREEASKNRNDRVGELGQGPSDTARGSNKWEAETKTSGNGAGAEDPGVEMQVHSAEEEKDRSHAPNHRRVLPHIDHTTKTQTCGASVRKNQSDRACQPEEGQTTDQSHARGCPPQAASRVPTLETKEGNLQPDGNFTPTD